MQAKQAKNERTRNKTEENTTQKVSCFRKTKIEKNAKREFHVIFILEDALGCKPTTFDGSGMAISDFERQGT